MLSFAFPEPSIQYEELSSARRPTCRRAITDCKSCDAATLPVTSQVICALLLVPAGGTLLLLDAYGLSGADVGTYGVHVGDCYQSCERFDYSNYLRQLYTASSVKLEKEPIEERD